MRLRSPVLTVSAAVALVVLAVVTFLMLEDPKAPVVVVSPPLSVPAPDLPGERAPAVPVSLSAENSELPFVEAPPSPPARTISTQELVDEYRQTKDLTTRGDLAQSIASMNDADSLRQLTTLFKTAKHPDEREALIASLAETDRDTGLESKLALLTLAVTGQPRNVRSAAVSVLAQMDDPRAAALLKRISETDSFREIRDAAKAVLEEK